MARTTTKRATRGRAARVANEAVISAGVAQVIGRAMAVIGGRSEALRWLGTPVHALDYATPVSLLGTGKGRDQVLSVLDQLEHGVL